MNQRALNAVAKDRPEDWNNIVHKVELAISEHHTLGEHWDQLMDEIQYNSLGGHFSLLHNGIYYGIEIDGHIHT